MKNIIHFSIIISLIYLGSCATLFKGSTEEVSFSSEPSKAKVYVNGQLMGKTPFPLNLESNKNYSIEFRLDGYENKTILINNSVGADWIILDVLFGLIPIIVDAATGDWYYLDNTNVRAALEELDLDNSYPQEQAAVDEPIIIVDKVEKADSFPVKSITQESSETVKDIDGNVYNTVIIGIQVWTKENLKTTKYNDGSPIPNVTDDTQWENLTTGAYSWHNNDAANYKNPYGGLYNWYAVETGKLCPTGWHVPTEDEWYNLAHTFWATLED
jgi:hypothetical protein